MKNSFMTFVALVLLVVLCQTISATGRTVGNTTNQCVANRLEYFKLSMQWQVAFCNGKIKCRIPPLEEFRIHGLWPLDANNDIIKPPCNGEGMPALGTVAKWRIKKQLDMYWPTLTGDNNYRFWAYEWENHGKCSGMKPLDYFNLAIYLAQSHLSLKSDLEDPEKQKLPVEAGTVNTRKHIKDALDAINPNIIAEVQCNQRRSQYQIFQINYCYTAGNELLRNCITDFDARGTESNVIYLNDLNTVPPEAAKNKAKEEQG